MADSSLSSALVRNGLIILMLLAALLSANDVQCSCYTFHDNTTLRDWDVSNKECKANGGQLVSLETLEEWEFIKTQLQTRTTSSSQDQWWIGLTRENGVWQWDSGRKLMYNKWKPGIDVYSTYQAHAIVEKYQGILWNTYWYQTMGSICEQRNTNCSANQIRRCYNSSATSTTILPPKISTTSLPRKTFTSSLPPKTSTPSLPPKTTLRDSTVALATSKVVRDVPRSTEPSFITSHTTAVASVTLSAYSTEQVNTENTEIRRRKTSTGLTMKVVIIIIVAVVLLLIIGIIIIVICICRRRHRARTRKKNKDEQEKFILQPQNGNNEPNYEPNNQPNDEPKSNIQEPYIYATVDKTGKTKNKTPEPIYENWRKPMYVNVEMPIYENFQQANHSMPQELNYVSVSECAGDDIHTEAPKPLEYEPTEYATLDINDPNN